MNTLLALESKAVSLGLYRVDSANTAWREVDGELVLINLETTFYYSLNATGAFIWSLLIDTPASIEGLSSAVAKEYAIDMAVARNDVEQIIHMLHEENLIQEVSTHE